MGNFTASQSVTIRPEIKTSFQLKDDTFPNNTSTSEIKLQLIRRKKIPMALQKNGSIEKVFSLSQKGNRRNERYPK